jgi:hypothetical protein
MRYTVIGMLRDSHSRIGSSRSNGARSRGPNTIADKQPSFPSALRQDLPAKQAVPPKETSANFDFVLSEHIRRFQPADIAELGVVEEIALVFWRLRRAWARETSLMDRGVNAAQRHDEVACIAPAFSTLAASHELALLHRQTALLHRVYQIAMSTFLVLHNVDAPNDPGAPSGYSGMLN